jgi:hypothetical protein
MLHGDRLRVYGKWHARVNCLIFVGCDSCEIGGAFIKRMEELSRLML